MRLQFALYALAAGALACGGEKEKPKEGSGTIVISPLPGPGTATTETTKGADPTPPPTPEDTAGLRQQNELREERERQRLEAKALREAEANAARIAKATADSLAAVKAKARADSITAARAAAQARETERLRLLAEARSTGGRGTTKAPPIDSTPKTTGPTGPDPAATRSFYLRSTPPGARVRLTSSAGKVYEPVGTNPARFMVPADIYTWEADLPGYMSDKSSARGIDLRTHSSDSLVLAMVPAGDFTTKLRRADAAFAAERCVDAVADYMALDRPEVLQSEVGRKWVESRGRLAQCERKNGHFDQAIVAYRQVLAAEPWQWRVSLDLAQTLCDNRDYRGGATLLRSLEGPSLNQVAAAYRQPVQALVTYGQGLCKVTEYRNNKDRVDLVDAATRLLTEFQLIAEDRLKGNIPADIREALSAAVRDAKAKLSDLSG